MEVQKVAKPFISATRVFSLKFGCDPEFFFEKDGKIIGAEKVLPKGKIGPYTLYSEKTLQGLKLDGVQAELSPRAHTCRANLGNEIGVIFSSLKRHLEGMKGISVCFRQCVDIEKDELDSLGADAKQFGCEPSFNIYDDTATVGENAATYLKRSGAGHLHFGLTDLKPLMSEEARKRLVILCDILIGNTCVLLDRDEGNIERRRLYGRAGEYRLPKHGLEYRTLSNFWLQSYQLFSLVTGLGRLAVSTLRETIVGHEALIPGDYKADAKGIKRYFCSYYSKPTPWDAEEELMRLVDLEKVREAINTNNFALAWKNYLGVRKFLKKFVPLSQDMGLDGTKLLNFEYFVKVAKRKGLKVWFPTDPLTSWSTMPEGHGHGWEAFLGNQVDTKRRAAAKVLLARRQARRAKLDAEKVKKEETNA